MEVTRDKTVIGVTAFTVREASAVGDLQIKDLDCKLSDIPYSLFILIIVFALYVRDHIGQRNISNVSLLEFRLGR